MMTRLTRLLTLTLLLAGALALPSAAHAFTVGMSDQKLGMWQDPRFQQLGVDQVRILMAYDAVLKGNFSRYDQWMAVAKARHADVLVTIDRSPRSYTRMPTLRQYRHVVRAIRSRYPFVYTFAAWNEANHKKQPTFRNPKRAAQYFNILHHECVNRCIVVAADVLDSKNMLPWLATFKRYARHAHIWGLHSYQDANRFRPLRATSTRQLLRAVRGQVWLTEAGGIVHFMTTYRGGAKGEQRAARALRQTFRIAASSPRIKRIYLYHWDAERRSKAWDSGFVAASGRARPALGVLRLELNRLRAKRRLPQLPFFTKFPKSKLPLFVPLPPDPTVAP
jgi:polysaccharide biosynthesis protein PslG